MKDVFKIVFVIIGTLIGAGFASGKEIYIFFEKFGILGLFGIIVSGILFGLIIYKLLLKIKKNKIKDYNELLFKIKNPIGRKLIKIIVNLFLLISFFIMIACFSAFINQIYNFPIYLSSIFFCLVCSYFFSKNISGLIKANEILVPLLIFLIIYLGIKNCFNLTYANTEIKSSNFGWLLKAILYVSYNSIILIPTICNLKLDKINNEQIKKISIFSSIFIILLAIIIFSLLLAVGNNINDLELPLINTVAGFGIIFKYLYEIIIILSIFTSSIGAGYSFLINVSKNKKQYFIFLILISIIGVLISNIGFSNLVENLYPLFGVLGLIQIIIIIK